MVFCTACVCFLSTYSIYMRSIAFRSERASRLQHRCRLPTTRRIQRCHAALSLALLFFDLYVSTTATRLVFAPTYTRNTTSAGDRHISSYIKHHFTPSRISLSRSRRSCLCRYRRRLYRILTLLYGTDTDTLKHMSTHAGYRAVPRSNSSDRLMRLDNLTVVWEIYKH